MPRVVRQSAEALKGAADRYLFISTISVYDPEGQREFNENSPLQILSDPNVEEITGETYGGLKVLCERVLEETWGSKASIVRPTYVVGPYDSTDRFTNWVLRLARGGKVLAGGRREQPIQFIDARDLAAFVLVLLERNVAGTFNTAGPGEEFTFEGFLERASSAIGSSAELVWIDPQKLEEIGGEPGKDFPLHHGPTDEGDPFGRTDSSRAIAQGLTFRPFDQTVRDTLQWASARGGDLKVGMSDERERELLAKASQ